MCFEITFVNEITCQSLNASRNTLIIWPWRQSYARIAIEISLTDVGILGLRIATEGEPDRSAWVAFHLLLPTPMPFHHHGLCGVVWWCVFAQASLLLG